jgi:hypothetical protein
MACTLDHTPHPSFLGLTSRNDHLCFFGSHWSPRYCEKQDDDTTLPRRTLRAPTLPGTPVILFSMVFVGDREAIVRTKSSAHETDKHPAPRPEHTVVERTPVGRSGTSTGRSPLRTPDRIPPRHRRHEASPKRNHCRAPHAKAMRPAAMYPVRPPPLLLQIRASHATDTEQGAASAQSGNQPILHETTPILRPKVWVLLP